MESDQEQRKMASQFQLAFSKLKAFFPPWLCRASGALYSMAKQKQNPLWFSKENATRYLEWQ